MNEAILSAILKDTYTLVSLKQRIRILKSYIVNALFGGQTPQQTFSREELDFLGSFDKTFYQNFQKDNVYQIFDMLEQQIQKLPILIIYLPFEAGDAISLQIGSYARKTFDKLLLLDTKFHPSLIAGAALSWKGVYRDYSVRAKIEEKKEEILQNFKKFLK